MIRWVLFGALGLVGFLVSLVMTLPASHAWYWAQGHVPAQVHGIRGTVWDGEASALIVQGQHLRDVRWRLQPAALLGAELRYQLQASVGDGGVSATAITGPGGQLRIEQLRFDADAADLIRRFARQAPPVGVSGRIDGFFDVLELDATGMPINVDGIVNWTDGAISLEETYPLGDYAVRLRTDTDGIGGEVATVEATLRIDGDFRLSVNGDVTGEVIYQAREGIHPDMIQGLQFLGIPEPRAENRIRFEGNINNPAGFQGRIL